jgi:hypothetical protein
MLIALGALGYPLALAIIVVPVGLHAGWGLRAPAIVIAGVVTGVSYSLVRLGRRMRATEGDEAGISQDPRPLIVYLRPFDADGVGHFTAWRSRVRARPVRRMFETTYEQRLARALRDVAPLVAIANPSERLLEPGAVRLRAEDWEWQRTVADLTSRAGSIILHAGLSDGLAWEIEHVVDLGTPERVIVALPSDAPRGQPSREARYAAFVRSFWGLFPRGLPDRAGESQFLIFDADWTPHRFGDRGPKAIPRSRDSLGEHRALVLERLQWEFKVSPFPYWLRAVTAGSALMLATLLVGTAIYAVLQ